jgi:hypothetical protein
MINTFIDVTFILKIIRLNFRKSIFPVAIRWANFFADSQFVRNEPYNEIQEASHNVPISQSSSS